MRAPRDAKVNLAGYTRMGGHSGGFRRSFRVGFWGLGFRGDVACLLQPGLGLVQILLVGLEILFWIT